MNLFELTRRLIDIPSTTGQELEVGRFLNSYLKSRGAQPVNLDPFRTLTGSTATGAAKTKRLTNLMELTVDTTWWTRYRARTKNPDLGDSFKPAIPGLMPAVDRLAARGDGSAKFQGVLRAAG